MAQKKVRILLAESGDGESADILRALFAQSDGGLELAVVGTVATLIPTIRVVDSEIILLDLTLSLRDPLDAVHLVHRSAPGTPLVVLADPTQKQYAAQSLSEGAMDYVLKGFLDTRTAACGGPPPEGAGRRYLQKPYSPTTLAHIVREILDGEPGANVAA